MYNFIEVCAGCGGLSNGFIQENFNPILLNDNDKICCKTLKENHHDTNIISGDFTKIDFTKIKEENSNIDIMMGGTPCQSFSLSGKKLGLDDERGNLFLEFIKKVYIIKPKIFLIENVKGLLIHNNNTTFPYLLNKINEILENNYKIYYKVLNANDYNVAQKRERLIIIGISKIYNKEYEFPKPFEYKPVLNDVLQNVPISDGAKYSENKRRVMELIPQGGCWINLPEEIKIQYMGNMLNSGGGKRGIARRLSMNEACLTLLTSPDQKQTCRCHPLETRPFTIREYARIQSFPDTYIFCGSINQQYKQIGNAVPCNLAKEIAKSIKKYLDEIEE
jgi:DNA (cytosine-5)-methyltransferase 1